MMLVAGFSGIGKTAVVNEVHKPIVRQRGYFIKGKFDQFNRNIPFSAFVQAFRDLMGQLLGESDQPLQVWKQKILQALGEQAQVIIDVIPELESIIGSQPPVAELSGIAGTNRFNLLFQKFIQVFTTKEHPLVIFLDDLQWIDSASLKLMQLLMSQSDRQYLLLIGAYRDNEVSPAHPLMIAVEEIKKTTAIVNQLVLGALTLQDINQLIADTLSCSDSVAAPLSELIAHKTQGNPFFIIQFLKVLYSDGILQFNWPNHSWECDLSPVRELTLTDDVVELMIRQLQKLSPPTQELLKLAACIGNQFNLESLAIISEKSLPETADRLWEALQAGLIMPLSKNYKFFTDELNGDPIPPLFKGGLGGDRFLEQSEFFHQTFYKFLHDRVQQAAYLLIPEAQKQSTHLKIGQLLLEKTPNPEQSEKLLEIVNQLNIGQSLITRQSERNKLARLNLIAGKKAKAATAYTAAVEYFTVGIDFLAADAWKTDYSLALALYESIAEATCLTGDFITMQTYIDRVMKESKSLLDCLKIYEVQNLCYIFQNNPLAAVNLGLEFLETLGIHLPPNPTQADNEAVLQNTTGNLLKQGINHLMSLPEMTDRQQVAAIRILLNIASSAYQAAPDKLLLILAKPIDLFLQSGNTSMAPLAYANYGLILCGVIENIEAGYELGQVALQLLDRWDTQEIKAKVLVNVSCLILHWKKHIRETLPVFIQGYQTGLESGDIEFAALGVQVYSYYAYFSGMPLEGLKLEIIKYQEAIQTLKQKQPLSYQELLRQVVTNLMERSPQPCQLVGTHYNELETLPKYHDTHNYLGLCYFELHKVILTYIFNDFSDALTHLGNLQQYLASATGLTIVPLFYFYDSLVNLAVYPHQTEAEQETILAKVTSHQAKLKKFADSAPMNYQHKFDLVEADRNRLLGNKIEAIESYDRAIAGAKENGFVNEEALGNELAAKFYLDWGKDKVASGYMTDAYYAYSRWGAEAKVADLETRYPQLLAPILQRETNSINLAATISHLTAGTSTSNTTSFSGLLDLNSVIKASQTLSSQMDLSELLSSLLQVVLQNAGGTKAALLLPQDDKLVISVIADLSTEQEVQVTSLGESLPLEQSLELPQSPINYVWRTKTELVVNDGSSDYKFISDTYLSNAQPKSWLCTPLIHIGKLSGILYLENQRSTGAFTSDRVEIIKVLSSQAAISIQNARLYEQAQNYAQQLEKYLATLKDAQLQLVQSEKMASLGQLVAGVAHEINNPLSFIAGNLQPAKEYIEDILNHLRLYQECYPDPVPAILESAEDIDLDYLIEDLPDTIASMKEGTDRIREISKSMRTFSRADTAKKVSFNLHEGIDSTLLILKHRLKANQRRPEIQIIKQYGDLPSVKCYPGQLNQVFMNLIANAIDALEEFNQGRSKEEIKANQNQITIQTEMSDDGQYVTIKIKDNGLGMTPEVKAQIFDHLYTTKPVGKGTGLGLSISRQIVVEKHGGTIACTSELGQGTEFAIALPI
jgi:predicted ATPase/signal transduction histidine kinase